MLLRASSKAVALQVQEEATMGGDGSALVEAGEELVAFGEALTLGSDELDAARARLRSKVGEATLIEAAAIAAIFNGLVRTADATGIPLDKSMQDATVQVRERLGINDFAGAQNTLG
ncbi:MAG: hypothetical protein CMQ13_05830 [Gammaproteobacteria bacterium]|jgi:alkylhydroperoxidase family enzyme|nr:hypothetical protein [Gammaproteobacteria bacterium]